MHSAFGVDHGEISKRERDTKRGALTGAAAGTAAGLGVAGTGAYHAERILGGMASEKLQSRRKTLKTLATYKPLRPVVAGTLGAGALAGTAIGAGAGAAIGRRKKQS